MPFRLEVDPVENTGRAVSITPGVRGNRGGIQGHLRRRDEEESGPAINVYQT